MVNRQDGNRHKETPFGQPSARPVSPLRSPCSGHCYRPPAGAARCGMHRHRETPGRDRTPQAHLSSPVSSESRWRSVGTTRWLRSSTGCRQRRYCCQEAIDPRCQRHRSSAGCSIVESGDCRRRHSGESSYWQRWERPRSHLNYRRRNSPRRCCCSP